MDTKINLLLFFAVCISFFFASCSPAGNEVNFTETNSFRFQRQARVSSTTSQREITQDSLVTVFSFSVKPGNDLVFKFEHNIIAPEGIQDAGLFETLVFQVPKDANTFEFKNEQLEQANTFFLRSCFCPEAGAAFKVTDGVVKGEKLSETVWHVNASVSTQTFFGNSRPVAFDDIFVIK